jgi:hypothetical protein
MIIGYLGVSMGVLPRGQYDFIWNAILLGLAVACAVSPAARFREFRSFGRIVSLSWLIAICIIFILVLWRGVVDLLFPPSFHSSL